MTLVVQVVIYQGYLFPTVLPAGQAPLLPEDCDEGSVVKVYATNSPDEALAARRLLVSLLRKTVGQQMAPAAARQCVLAAARNVQLASKPEYILLGLA